MKTENKIKNLTLNQKAKSLIKNEKFIRNFTDGIIGVDNLVTTKLLLDNYSELELNKWYSKYAK